MYCCEYMFVNTLCSHVRSGGWFHHPDQNKRIGYTSKNSLLAGSFAWNTCISVILNGFSFKSLWHFLPTVLKPQSDVQGI
jgi:hypothetical protein